MANHGPEANSIVINHEHIIKMFRLIDSSIAAIRAGIPCSPGGSRQNNEDASPTGLRGQSAAIKKICDDAAAAQETYFIGVSPFIVAHRMLTTNIRGSVDTAHMEAESNIRAAYFEFIGERGIASIIDRCIDALSAIITANINSGAKSKSDNYAELSDLDTELRRVNRIPARVECVLGGDCECGGEFVMYAESNERKCSSCGMAASIIDDHVEDQNMYSKEIQKTKQNRHHPIHHCKLWISRIQATAPVNIPDTVYAQLKTCFTRDNVNLRNMSCGKLRKYLKEKKLTTYNNYVPFIRKNMCGISPPELTTAELEQFYEMFARVAKILHDIRPDNNINYYPGFIFKILDEQLPLSTRKVQIMECIHLQSEDTIKEIDNLYAQICARMGRTDRPRPINWGEYKKFL